MWRAVSRKKCLLALLGSIILAFGLYNIHSISGVTEGGILGLTLLLQYLLGLSPAVTSLVLNLLCYALGWRTLGREFLVYSLIATGGFSAAYAVFERFPVLWPGIADLPLLAAVLGAVFVGVGAGLSVRAGGATGGDDALAMSLSKLTGLGIQWIYLACDLLVLGASLVYIPWRRIIYSLLTVVISGQLVGVVQRAGKGTATDTADTADMSDTDTKKDR
ncbi:MAG: YitT family protein [Firmicutes bacterium]|nr:YitT family protein [Bacillota bacterium]